MYNKFVEAMVERAIENYFDSVTFNREVTYNKESELVYFRAGAIERSSTESHIYEGFVGATGQITVTKIDFKRLTKEEYITLN